MICAKCCLNFELSTLLSATFKRLVYSPYAMPLKVFARCSTKFSARAAVRCLFYWPPVSRRVRPAGISLKVA